MLINEISDPERFAALNFKGVPHQQISIVSFESDPADGGSVHLFQGCSDTLGNLAIRLPRGKYTLHSYDGAMELDFTEEPLQLVYVIEITHH
jgi:hypothetical protein